MYLGLSFGSKQTWFLLLRSRSVVETGSESPMIPVLCVVMGTAEGAQGKALSAYVLSPERMQELSPTL